jgi:hypothetical protein
MGVNMPDTPREPIEQIVPDEAPRRTVEWPIDKEFLQNDIARAIDFRKEYYKYTIGIATALLAFTISFPPNLTTISFPWLIFAAWIGLGIAVILGVLVHYMWARFFSTWRDYDNRRERERGRAVRDRITWWRRKADVVQNLGVGARSQLHCCVCWH